MKEEVRFQGVAQKIELETVSELNFFEGGHDFFEGRDDERRCLALSPDRSGTSAESSLRLSLA